MSAELLSKDHLLNLTKAVIFCMDYGMSQVNDDEEYSKMVDLQNELKEAIEAME